MRQEAFVTDEGQQAIKTTIQFAKLADEGIYYITMTPCEGTVSLLSGAYTTDAEKEDVNRWKQLLGICTSLKRGIPKEKCESGIGQDYQRQVAAV